MASADLAILSTSRDACAIDHFKQILTFTKNGNRMVLRNLSSINDIIRRRRRIGGLTYLIYAFQNAGVYRLFVTVLATVLRAEDTEVPSLVRPATHTSATRVRTSTYSSKSAPLSSLANFKTNFEKDGNTNFNIANSFRDRCGFDRQVLYLCAEITQL
jgi:hypothetical protein